MIEARPITRAMILEGIGTWVPCYMYGIRKREWHCDMWVTLYDEVGGIGFYPLLDEKPAGQLFFMPKRYARRIGLPTCRTNENLDKTMVIGCLCVFPEYTNRGIAAALVKALIAFCKEKGYTRIECTVDPRSPDQTGLNISSYPFRKFGFTIDEESCGWESRPETRTGFFDVWA